MQINEALYNDLINNPTEEELAIHDNRFSNMEANNMNEQGFGVGYNNSGEQTIQNVDGIANTQVKTGMAEATLAAS